MRTNFVGNTCNYAYWFSKLFLRTGLLQARAFIESTKHKRDLPEWEREASAKDSDEDWIRYLPDTAVPGGFLSSAWSRTDLAKADIIHSFGALSAMWAQKTGLPYVYHSYGDINSTPFFTGPIRYSTPLRVLLARRAIRGARAVVLSQLSDFDSANRLGLTRGVVVLPIPYDCDVADVSSEAGESALTPLVPPGAITFYVPSRVATFKRHDKIVRCFAALKRQRASDAVLVFADWGDDVDWLRAHISAAGIAKDVRWVPCLPKTDLLRAMRHPSTLILDEFPDAPQWSFGGVSRDAMAAGVPLLTKVSLDGIGRLHSEPPPILWTDGSEASILVRLNEFIDMSVPQRTRLADGARAWMRREHHYTVLLPRYLSLYRECAAQ